MKHYCLIPGLLLPAILMMSCAKIQTEATDSPEHGMSGPDGGSVTIAASITEPTSSIIPSTAIAHTGNIPDSAGNSNQGCIGDGTDTKTYVGSVENGIYKLYWSTGDKISVNGTTSNALAEIEAGIEQKDFQVSWDRDNAQSWPGGYGRVHRLNDGRLMAVYEAHVCNGYCRFSEDNGLTWTDEALALPKAKHTVNEETVWSNIANSEFAQLSHTHPHHPDRIIYAGNIRPSGTRSDLMPYSICYVTSDDGGSSWSKRKIIYESNTWSTAIAKGCWEPFVLELPDGTVQIYFADETPYYRLGLGYQNISVIESKDGGDSWGEARIAAYTMKYRDGMPVVMLYDGNIYLAIEHYEGSGQHLHPQIVYTSVEDNWSKVIYGSDSEHRFDPMQKTLDYVNNYYGAPYLIETDDFFVLSYQSSEGASKPSADNSVMEVVVSPKSEFQDGKFTTMRTPTRPVTVDQSTGKARWNSLCDLGNNEVLAVSDLGGTLC